jgi:biotin carboxylase
MERPPHVMLIGGSDVVLTKLTGLPLRVTYAQRASALTRLSSACVLRALTVDYTDSRAMLAIAGALHAEDPLDAVISVDEYALGVAAEITELLHISGFRRDTVRMGRDKHAMRERLHSTGADSTRYRLCENVAEAERFAAETGDGIILKPVDGAGGQGVCEAANVADVSGAWNFTKSTAKASRILAEERIGGQEYSVETLTAKGQHMVVAITKKTTTGAPYFIEVGHATSGDITQFPDGIAQSVRAALDAIGVEAGACHTEVIADGGRTSIVEINTRMGGAFIWDIVELATGIDLFRGSLTCLLGSAPSPGISNGGAAIAFAQSAEYGLVKAIHGVDAARAMPGVIRVDRIPASGTMVYPVSNRAHRLAYAIAVGETADEARARAARAAGALRLELTALPASAGDAGPAIATG